MENNSSDRVGNPECGILIHELPKDAAGNAASFLPRDIKRRIPDPVMGLKVYFSRKDRVEESLLLRRIKLNGISYNIYPLVTCLTIYGIPRSVPKETIKGCFRNKDLPVLDLYNVLDTDDYRVVLNIPEVKTYFDPTSIKLHKNLSCSMTFFCRLCREEGHKQYQCRKLDSTQPYPSNDGDENSEAVQNQQTLSKSVETRVKSPTNRKRKNNATSVTRNSAGSVTRALKNDGEISNNLPLIKNASLLPRSAGEPSTSSASTAAENLAMKRERTKQKLKRGIQSKSQSSRRKCLGKKKRNNFPCREILKIISKISGTLSPESMTEFLEDAHGKQQVLRYARKATDKIPDLIEQLKKIISYYNKQGDKSGCANSDIRILTRLYNRLIEQFGE